MNQLSLDEHKSLAHNLHEIRDRIFAVTRITHPKLPDAEPGPRDTLTNNDFTAGSVKAYVKSAPVGADLTFSVYVGSATDPWMTLTIPAGSTSVAATAAQIDAAATIPANTNVRLAITAVGTTYPGSDLSVFVYS